MINRKLRKQLLAMMKVDQYVRRRIKKSNKPFIEVDKKNIHKLKKIIDVYGWPDKKLAGTKGARAAWLIAQHADHDIRFQKKCLSLIIKKHYQKLVDSEHVAYITDRVLVNEGKKQLYGTQFYRNSKGEYTYRPINNEKLLDIRRKEMGLIPFQKYKQHMIKLNQ